MQGLLKKQAKRESESSGGEHRCDWNKMDNRPFGEEVTELFTYEVDKTGTFYADIRDTDYVNTIMYSKPVLIIKDENGEPLARLKQKKGTAWDGNLTYFYGNINLTTSFTTEETEIEDVNYFIGFRYHPNTRKFRVSCYDENGEVSASKCYFPYFVFINEEITPLDEKFIPETIARKSDISESSGGGECEICTLTLDMENGTYSGCTIDELKDAITNKTPIIAGIYSVSDGLLDYYSIWRIFYNDEGELLVYLDPTDTNNRYRINANGTITYAGEE